MMTRSIATACVLLASLAAVAADDMTHEETMVRTAYAKLAYISEEGAVGRLAMEALTPAQPVDKQYAGMTSDQRLAAAQLSIALQDFVVGDVRDILSRKAVDFISPAVGEKLQGGMGVPSFSVVFPDTPTLATHWNSLEASWQPVRPPDPGLNSVTVADLYQLQWHKNRPATIWQRYISYTVTVSFQGETHGPYKAIFIFGHDAEGNEVVQPEDATIDPGWLVAALHEHLFPDAFVLTSLRTFPVVANWLNVKQMSGPSCTVGPGDVCCDLIKLRCGPGGGDVAEGLSKPLPVPAPR